MVRERSTKAFKVRGAPFSELLPFFVALTPDSLKYLLHNLNKAGSTGKVLCEFVFILEYLRVGRKRSMPCYPDKNNLQSVY
jgi:hypothetical protein